MTRFIVALIVIIAIVAGGYFAFGNNSTHERVFVPEDTPQSSLEPSQGKLMSVESYVTENISALSPIKETMGGTFYVTQIEVEPEEHKGHVKYEDGHNAYEADFTYTSNDRTGHTITSFVIQD